VVSNDTLRSYMANRYAISLDMLPYGLLSTSAKDLVSGPTPINRLDHPVLEHHMASIDGNTRLYRFSDTLVEKVKGNEIALALRPWFEWDPGGFAYWAETRLLEGSLLDETIEQIMKRQYGDLVLSFSKAALQNAESVGTAEAYEVAGKRLYERDDYLSAETALNKALAMDPQFDSAHYYLGRCLERRGADEDALVSFRRVLQLDPEHSRARQAIERISSGAAD
jgi:tetratricopeptide (TPR) repeat protein